MSTFDDDTKTMKIMLLPSQCERALILRRLYYVVLVVDVHNGLLYPHYHYPGWNTLCSKTMFVEALGMKMALIEEAVGSLR